jgi:hypothetical protein
MVDIGHARNVTAARQLRSRKEAIPTSKPHVHAVWHDAGRWRPRLRLPREFFKKKRARDSSRRHIELSLPLAPTLPLAPPLRIPPSFPLIAHRKTPPCEARPVSRHCCMLHRLPPHTRDCRSVRPYASIAPRSFLAHSSNACSFSTACYVFLCPSICTPFAPPPPTPTCHCVVTDVNHPCSSEETHTTSLTLGPDHNNQHIVGRRPPPTTHAC